MGHIDYGITPASFSPSPKGEFGEVEFSVPLYQRLFVWEEEQINQLFNDLYQASKKNPSYPYYIGTLTVKRSDDKRIWDLVDGQQRITALTLLGACLDKRATSSIWRPFITKGGCPRLKYPARPADQEFLKVITAERLDAKAEAEKPDAKAKNVNMSNFIKLYERFAKENKLVHDESDDLSRFSNFVYEKATALVSILPEKYGVNDLNLYFEKLNSAGKQLEAHEILKVRDFGDYSARWNAVADFSQALKPENLGSSEDNRDAEDVGRASEKPEDNKNATDITLEQLLSGSGLSEGEKKEPEKEQAAPDASRLVMSFPVFLLHVLRVTVGEDFTGPWDTKRLLSTFKKWKSNGGSPEKFVENMEKYREWMDKWIIHIEEDPVPPYNAGSKDSDDDKVVDAHAGDIWHFQSMLYVSCSDALQKWVLDAYLESGKLWLDETPNYANKEKFLTMLKRQDNALHKFPSDGSPADWSYENIDRYWFWKLDYILWERRDPKFFTSKDHFVAVDKYVFRRNRSIEHLHPQNNSKWKPEDLHHFGNLAMISASFNSQQGDDSINTKFGRLQDQVNENRLESIKLLCMFVAARERVTDWTPEASNKHCKEMIDILGTWYNGAGQAKPNCGVTPELGEGDRGDSEPSGSGAV